jgi:acyl carrier protein
VIDTVSDLVAELHPHRVPPVHLDSSLEWDLGLDSLALAELLTRLEDAAGLELPASLLRVVDTPRGPPGVSPPAIRRRVAAWHSHAGGAAHRPRDDAAGARA